MLNEQKDTNKISKSSHRNQSDILYNIADSLRHVTNRYNAHTKTEIKIIKMSYKYLQ